MMSTPFRLLAITQGPQDPCTRYRLGLYLPLMAAAGVEVESITWPTWEAERSRVVQQAGAFDAVLIHRRLLPYRHIRALRAAAKRLAYDFDDAVIYRDSAAGRPKLLLDKLWQFRALVSRCDAVTAGNNYLAELAANHALPQRIHVLPTVIDLSRYNSPILGLRRSAESTVLGWIGQRSTLPYLEQLACAIRELSSRRAGVTLHCIADATPKITGVVTETRTWRSTTEVAELRSLCIGLAPLPDDVWTRGKCGLRLLQYLAAGVPAVASPVGTQAEIVASGAALPVRGDQQWVAAIETLIDDTQRRAQLIASGRAIIEERFVPSVWLPTVLAAWCGQRGQIPSSPDQRNPAWSRTCLGSLD